MNNLPSNESLEYLVLSSMSSDPDNLRLGVDNLTVKDFYNALNVEIFTTLKSLQAKGTLISMQEICIEMEKTGKQSKEEISQIVYTLLESSPVMCNFEEHIQELNELRKRRETIFACIETANRISKDQSSDNAIESLVQQIKGISNTSQDKNFLSDNEVISNFKDGLSLQEYYEKMGEDTANGVTPDLGVQSYYEKLDSKIGGFCKGSLTFIGARTSMGKTTFAINLIANQAYSSKSPKILVLSLEMQVADLKERLLCVCTGVSSKKAKLRRLNKYEADKLISFERNHPTPNLYWEGTPLSIGKLRAKIRRFHQQNGIQIVYIDLLSKLKSDTPNANFAREVSEITRGLQDLALELNIAIICLAQLNREVTSRTDKTPQLSDFKNSGSIEEDSDLCLLIHRPEYYDATDKTGITQIIVAKNRLLGELGKVEFIMENGRMQENTIESLEGGL